MIFAIVAFGCAADYTGTSYINFIMFTGVTAFVLSLVFMVAYLCDATAVRGAGELVVDVIWSIFWLSAAAALSAKIGSSWPSALKASNAFSWMSWILWMISGVLSFLAMRAKGSVVIKGPAPGAPVSSAPVAPTGSVSMV